ncbi:MAG: hypothetical protein ACI9AB_001516, partial [Urechidicola sp.]
MFFAHGAKIAFSLFNYLWFADKKIVLNRKSLFHLSIFTLFGFSLIGYILLHFTKSLDFWEMLALSYFNIK